MTFVNPRRTLKFEFDPEEKIIYFEGRGSGKVWIKKQNYAAFYDVRLMGRKKKPKFFSFADLIPAKYRASTLISRHIAIPEQHSSESQSQ